MLAHFELANAIRALSMDAVQKANSGHPGMPMGMADIAEVLWNHFLKHNPNNPHWLNRDRFVVSNGHGCMLLYSLLHLTGYDLSLNDLKNFRQLHSKTPGHPEYGYTPGVETTTGPLGQGLANAVGMAIAERKMAAEFNRDNHKLIDHYTYAFVGDGCLMEGISHEACSLAGTLGLGKLIVFYDDNDISIDGDVRGWFTDNTAERFKAYHWQVIGKIDGHDPKAIQQAIEQARQETSKPSLIICKTKIGFGSPNLAGKAKCHGSPLGQEEINAAKQQLNWPYGAFEIPETIYAAWNKQETGQALESQWQSLFENYQQQYPQQAGELTRRIQGKLPENWLAQSQQFIAHLQKNPQNIATRKASQIAIEHHAAVLPEMIGGSADLTGSNLTNWSGSHAITPEQPNGNYIFYGVREFGMAAIMNGLALYAGMIPYGGTFAVFTDYARNAIRLSALMKQRVIYVLTHDSIGLGEDGPTHQPIEHAAMLRLTPNLNVWRPCDAVETAVAWQQALLNHTMPTALLLSRQNIEQQPRNEQQVINITRGGYILHESNGEPDAILIATGSEIPLAMAVAKRMKDKNIRVVSMPSCNVFDEQEPTYQQSVLPNHCRHRIAIEAAHSDYWFKYTGLDGLNIGLKSFGESAPAEDLYDHFGLTEDKIFQQIDSYLRRQ